MMQLVGSGWYCIVRSVWFWLVLLVQPVWSCLVLSGAVNLVPGWHYIVQSVWFLVGIVSAASLVLPGIVWCSQFGSWFSWYCIVQSSWSGWHGIVQSVWFLVGTVSAASLVLSGTVWCSQFGYWLVLHSAVWLVWFIDVKIRVL